mgnify:CR=1 FL=1
MSILDRVIVAAPCPITWESMVGDERVRHCSGCSRNVYNISDMSSAEAESFFEENGTSQCIRLFRRQDGTVMTDNCPVGLRTLRDKSKLLFRIVAGFLAQAFAISTACAQDTNNNSNSLPPGAAGGMRVMPPQEPPTKKITIINSDDCTKVDKDEKNKIKKTNKPVKQLHPTLTGSDTAKPQFGDTHSWDLYQNAKMAAEDGKFIVAKTMYLEALKANEESLHSDPKFAAIIRTGLKSVEDQISPAVTPAKAAPAKFNKTAHAE